MKTCNNCSKSIDDDFLFCPHCGIKIEEPKNEPIAENEKAKTENVKWYNKTSVAVATVIVGIIAWILIIICMGTGNNSESKKIKQENEDNIRYIIAMMEIDGWTCIKDGYIFEKCAEVSRAYLGYNYAEDFYDNHVVVTTKDLKIYYLSGFTKSGKSIDVCIGHSAPDWYIIDASVYEK